MLDLRVLDIPGTYFIYNSGNSTLLTGIIKNSTDFSPDQFAKKIFFELIGIERFKWGITPI